MGQRHNNTLPVHHYTMRLASSIGGEDFIYYSLAIACIFCTCFEYNYLSKLHYMVIETQVSSETHEYSSETNKYSFEEVLI